MSSLFIKRTDGTIHKLSEHPCKNETIELQDALAISPDLLPGDQIKPESQRRWLLVKREMPIPDPNSGGNRWSLDFLYLDQSAIPTFVECKQYKDTRSRREVVGQVLEYAANAHWTFEELEKCADETAKDKGSTLIKAIEALQPDEELRGEETSDFFKKAIRNLEEGFVRLIFFLEKAPQELKILADYLNRQMERTEVLIVEAKQYFDGQNIIVVPYLFGYAEQASLKKEPPRIIMSSSERRKWDDLSFFEEAKKGLRLEQLNAIQLLYDFAINSANTVVSWGTGKNRGSFNPKFTDICPRALFTVYTDGLLSFNFGNLNGSEAADACRNKLFLAIREKGLLELTDEDIDSFPSFAVDKWYLKVEDLISLIKEAIQVEKDGVE